MLPRLGCLFIVVPLVELALLIQVGRWVGVWPTIGLVALTGLLGMVLVRREGLRTLARIQAQLARGEMPGQALMDGACLLVGGAFLVTPGVLTDVFAFALLAAPTRRLLQDWALRRVRGAMSRGTLDVRVGGWPGAGPWGGGPGGGGPAPGRDPRVDPRDSAPGVGGRSGGSDENGGDDDEPPRAPRPGEIVQE